MHGKMFKQLQDTTWPNSIIQSYIYPAFKHSNLLQGFGCGHQTCNVLAGVNYCQVCELIKRHNFTVITSKKLTKTMPDNRSKGYPLTLEQMVRYDTVVQTPTDNLTSNKCCVHHLLSFVLFFMSSLLNVLNTCFLSSLCLFSFLSSSFCSSFLCSSILFLVAAFNCLFLWLYDTFSVFISAATCGINIKNNHGRIINSLAYLLLIHLGFTNYRTTVTATTCIMHVTEITRLI